MALAAMPPTAYTGQASAATTTSVTVTGSVDPSNQETSYHFEFGPTTAYGAQTPTATVAAGNQSIRVTTTITNLSAGATYHYRLVAVNPTGTVDGQDRVFTTKKIPLTFKLYTASHHQVYGTPFSVIGELLGTGNANHPVVLQENPFPFLFGFKNVGAAVSTDAGGHFAFPMMGLTSNTQLRVSTLDTPPVHSAVIVELLGVRVTLHVRRSGRPGWANFYGTVTPAQPGASVNIQLVRRHHSPRTLAATTLKGSGKSGSRFSLVARIRHAGLYRAHVQVLSGAQFSNSSSLILIR
ncbi:MAG TPA: hypothetical protein VNR42_10300 [Solirubrobacteraceae bacterium]|nr:hypothetical protein [Solirubrobacteraceae bacterium]